VSSVIADVSSVIDWHRRVAYDLYRDRREPDPDRNWSDAKRCLIETWARKLSQQPGRKTKTPVENWIDAVEEIEWSEWAESQLLPYLAICSVTEGHRWAGELEREAPLGGTNGVGFAATLDGAPEFSRSMYRRHRANCVDPKVIVESKDGAFLHFCKPICAMFGADLVRMNRPSHRREADSRSFQDAALAAFWNRDGSTGVCRALSAGLLLLRSLAQHNVEKCRSWQDELHARIVIAESWDRVLSWKSNTRRDEIAIDASLFRNLDSDLKTVLLATGVRLRG
jgi:hypothetical protein